MPQAAAYLHWADWLRAAAIKAGKRPLFINLDETSISRSWPQSRGNVLKKQMWISKHRPPTVKASKAEYRGTITGVLMITHDEVIQRALPQVYIGNTHVFPKKALEKAMAGHPGVVHFWREKSSWNSPTLMRKIVALLAEALSLYKFNQYWYSTQHQCTTIELFWKNPSGAKSGCCASQQGPLGFCSLWTLMCLPATKASCASGGASSWQQTVRHLSRGSTCSQRWPLNFWGAKIGGRPLCKMG